MFSLTVCILLGVMVVLSSASSINGAKSLALTIYDQDYAMVKDVREIDFDQGNSDLFFTDVSSNIQTETVAFKALNDTENIRVYEQNYEANLINTPAILQKYIDKKLVVYAKVGSDSRQVNGTLLGFNSGQILQTPFGIEILNNLDGVTLSSLPDGFFTLPTLNWKVSSAKKITSNCEVSYRTNGFSWHADYLVILNQAETKADVGGWVTIDNQSGKKYTNSKVKLIAKDVKAANKNMNIWNGNSFSGQVAPLGSSSSSSVTQSSFSDFHMYTLSQPTTLNENSQKQIEFIPKVYNVGVKKYNQININTGGNEESNLKASNKVDITNAKANKLGIPFPKGTVRVFKADEADGSLEFLGESNIDHTPKDETFTVTTGNAFDIVANKIVTRKDSTKNSYDADMNLTITNRKTTNAEIVININNGRGNNLKMTWNDKSLVFQPLSANLMRLRKTLKPDEKYTLLWNEVDRW